MSMYREELASELFRLARSLVGSEDIVNRGLLDEFKTSLKRDISKLKKDASIKFAKRLKKKLYGKYLYTVRFGKPDFYKGKVKDVNVDFAGGRTAQPVIVIVTDFDQYVVGGLRDDEFVVMDERVSSWS